MVVFLLPVLPPSRLLRPGGCLAGVHAGKQSLSVLRVRVFPPAFSRVTNNRAGAAPRLYGGTSLVRGLGFIKGSHLAHEQRVPLSSFSPFPCCLVGGAHAGKQAVWLILGLASDAGPPCRHALRHRQPSNLHPVRNTVRVLRRDRRSPRESAHGTRERRSERKHFRRSAPTL